MENSSKLLRALDLFLRHGLELLSRGRELALLLLPVAQSLGDVVHLHQQTTLLVPEPLHRALRHLGLVVMVVVTVMVVRGWCCCW